MANVQVTPPKNNKKKQKNGDTWLRFTYMRKKISTYIINTIKKTDVRSCPKYIVLDK